jgi:hypothetical protein
MGFNKRLRAYAQTDFQLGFPSPTDWQTLADLSLPIWSANDTDYFRVADHTARIVESSSIWPR